MCFVPTIRFRMWKDDWVRKGFEQATCTMVQGNKPLCQVFVEETHENLLNNIMKSAVCAMEWLCFEIILMHLLHAQKSTKKLKETLLQNYLTNNAILLSAPENKLKSRTQIRRWPGKYLTIAPHSRPGGLASADVVPVGLLGVFVDVGDPLVGPARGVVVDAVGDREGSVLAGVRGRRSLGARPRSFSLQEKGWCE